MDGWMEWMDGMHEQTIGWMDGWMEWKDGWTKVDGSRLTATIGLLRMFFARVA